MTKRTAIILAAVLAVGVAVVAGLVWLQGYTYANGSNLNFKVPAIIALVLLIVVRIGLQARRMIARRKRKTPPE